MFKPPYIAAALLFTASAVAAQSTSPAGGKLKIRTYAKATISNPSEAA